MRRPKAAGARDQRTTPTAADWRTNTVACRDTDTNAFFDDTKTGIAAAKAICDTCGWLKECREYALTKPEKYGVFGGMGADERKAERRNRWRRGATTKPTVPVDTTIDATGTRRRLQALAAIGIGVRTVESRITTAGHDYLDKVRRGARTRVGADIALDVAAAYRALVSMGGTPTGGAAMAAARKRGWAEPGAWAGVDIDDPAAEPNTRKEAA